MLPAASPCTDALRAAGWQPVEPLPCGCTPERLCAPHGWLRDAEQWERYVHGASGSGEAMQISETPDAIVRLLSVEEMRQERAELVTAAGMTEESLRAHGAAWELASHERGILQRIEGLDFLLANTPG